jgi:hypothetical protein
MGYPHGPLVKIGPWPPITPGMKTPLAPIAAVLVVLAAGIGAGFAISSRHHASSNRGTTPTVSTVTDTVEHSTTTTAPDTATTGTTTAAPADDTKTTGTTTTGTTTTGTTTTASDDVEEIKHTVTVLLEGDTSGTGGTPTSTDVDLSALARKAGLTVGDVTVTGNTATVDLSHGVVVSMRKLGGSWQVSGLTTGSGSVDATHSGAGTYDGSGSRSGGGGSYSGSGSHHGSTSVHAQGSRSRSGQVSRGR